GGFAVGAIVEVEGLPDANGVIVASKIELQSGGTPAPQPEPQDVEIVGTIDALPASGLIGTWQVAGRSVVVTAATELDAENGAFAVGVTVEVEGALDVTGTLVAAKVESKPGSGASEPSVEFFSSQLGHFFVTASTAEIAALNGGAFGGAWQRTGQTFNVGGTTAVCRFYGMPPRGPDSHFFTADPTECSFVMGQFSAWTFE